MPLIDCFLNWSGEDEILNAFLQLKKSGLIAGTTVVHIENNKVEGYSVLKTSSLLSTETIRKISRSCKNEYVLLALQDSLPEVVQFGIERLLQVAVNTGAAMVYADYYEIRNGQKIHHPVIDYQDGSLRDDFDFGPVLLFRKDVLKSYSAGDYKHAGLYSLRLHASRLGELVRVPEPLFSIPEMDARKSGEKQFDYVRSSAREKQVEMERACTEHLEMIGALLNPPFLAIDPFNTDFPIEASVVIPVRNRVKTIRDAVESVLSQKTLFPFNLIVVDNYSTDGTTEFLAGYAKQGKLIHIIPESKELGIGGCWNEAIFHPKCGKFAVQLDSDDLYSSEKTLQTIVDKFYKEQCAMVIGSYQMVDFNLNEIPPGVIDHKEWTPENGPNNALRINGLGAPRAFFTPVLREIRIPNVSYGEDYAVGLAISRKYRIGRIYEPIYLCRRWDDNTDASLDIVKLNSHNLYKDRIRTIELKARLNLND